MTKQGDKSLMLILMGLIKSFLSEDENVDWLVDVINSFGEACKESLEILQGEQNASSEDKSYEQKPK